MELLVVVTVNSAGVWLISGVYRIGNKLYFFYFFVLHGACANETLASSASITFGIYEETGG